MSLQGAEGAVAISRMREGDRFVAGVPRDDAETGTSVPRDLECISGRHRSGLKGSLEVEMQVESVSLLTAVKQNRSVVLLKIKNRTAACWILAGVHRHRRQAFGLYTRLSGTLYVRGRPAGSPQPPIFTDGYKVNS